MTFSKRVLKSGAYFFIVCLLALSSCTSTKTIVGGEVNPSLSAKRVIQNHYGNEADFKTLASRVKIEYSNTDDQQGVTVNFRMKKDEMIWMSAPFGVVKALITPEKVSFYNKLEGEYFEGDFSYLSNYVGIDLDFEQLQNVLLGNAIMDLRKEKYTMATDDSRYILNPRQASTFLKSLFLIEPRHFRVDEQQLSQSLEDRSLNISYKYQSVQSKVIPENVTILATDSGETNNIFLEYRNVELDKELNFPYKIPSGYEKIELE